MSTQKHSSMFEMKIVVPAIADSFKKLNPRVQMHNPVMFVVYVGSILTTVLLIHSLFGSGEARPGFIFNICAWLWVTVLFANFAEAVAQWRGKAQAEALRKTRQDVPARRLHEPHIDSPFDTVSASTLQKGEIVLIREMEFIPADGEVIVGVASVDESSITGEALRSYGKAAATAAL